MKCPLCEGEMQLGKVAVQITGLAWYLENQPPEDCWFEPIEGEMHEREMLVRGNDPRPALRCPECDIILLWGRQWIECTECGAQVNPLTRAGLSSPEKEPWTLLCNECQTELKPDL